MFERIGRDLENTNQRLGQRTALTTTIHADKLRHNLPKLLKKLPLKTESPASVTEAGDSLLKPRCLYEASG